MSNGTSRSVVYGSYKRQAVALGMSSRGSITSVSKELGLRDSVLRRWVDRVRQELASAAWRPTMQATPMLADKCLGDRPVASEERTAAHGVQHFKECRSRSLSELGQELPLYRRPSRHISSLVNLAVVDGADFSQKRVANWIWAPHFWFARRK